MFFKAIVNFAKQKFNEDICGKTSKRPAKQNGLKPDLSINHPYIFFVG